MDLYTDMKLRGLIEASSLADENELKNRKKKVNYLIPGMQEIKNNPRSRSAKIRAFMRTDFNEN